MRHPQWYRWHMEQDGEAAAIRATEGNVHYAQAFAQSAYHYMRLAGISPFDNNLNLNIGTEAA